MSQLSKYADDWLEATKHHFEKIDIKLLTCACQYAESFNADTPPPFAESALSQGLNMANELLALNCDSQTLAAAITYPAIHYNQPTKESIEKNLGKNVYKILSNAKKLEAIQDIHSPPSIQLSPKKVDSLRKMLLAIVDDVRIVLIKLAECLTIMKYLRKEDTVQRQQIAEQTMYLFAPLANRLGIGQLKWQLEDFSFRYLHPDKYEEISKSLKMHRNDRDQYIREMIKNLTTLFKKAGIKNIEISGRAKHIYSIYRKMQKKDITFKQLFDTNAFRILVTNIEDCYQALSLVHAEWPHIAEEFDDYIAKPKPNGYQSIHTAVTGPKEINVEIQIRTYQMHEDAELGVAAHWKYKEGNTDKTQYEEKITRLREVMDWQQEMGEQDTVAENIYEKIFEDSIYVFTPNGDIFDLEPGATPLDFAYRIHSEVGNRCKGAKVNDKLVPLTHILKTADRVEILTAKEGKPSRDWLSPTQGYIKTNQARVKIRHWFKKENYEIDLEEGEKIWDKTCRREGFKKTDLNQVHERFNFKKPDDLLAAIGGGDIGIATVVHALHAKDTTTKKAEAVVISKKPHEALPSTSELSIEGVDNLLTQIAKCCKPIPGDPILGYITKGRGVSIHHQKCRNVKQAITYRPQRIIDVNWGSKEKQTYPVDLSIDADDRPGLIRDITGVIANENMSLYGLNSRADKIKNRAYINLTLEINSLDNLQKIISHLKQVAGIIEVKRN